MYLLFTNRAQYFLETGTISIVQINLKISDEKRFPNVLIQTVLKTNNIVM